MKQRKGWRTNSDVGKANRAHSPTFPSLHLRHSSFPNASFSLPTSQFILQPFCLFTYVTSFSNPSVAIPTSQLILQPFRRFIFVTAHSPTLLSLYLRHSSLSDVSVASPTSQLILQPFFRFYVTGSSPGEPLMPPKRLQRPTAQDKCQRSSTYSIFWISVSLNPISLMSLRVKDKAF